MERFTAQADLNQLIEDFSLQHNISSDLKVAIKEAFIDWNKAFVAAGSPSNLNDYQEKLTSVEVIFFDFDGVMTDNKVYTDQFGNESVRCDRGDGLGIKQLKALGKKVFILSTEKNPVVIKRAEKLQVECFSSCDDKAEFLELWMAKHGYISSQLAFVGNDINDLGAMQKVGLSMCPQDSEQSVLKLSDIVIPRDGGNKIVRAVADFFVKNDKKNTEESIS